MNRNNFNLAAWLLLGIGGLIIFIVFFNHAFPTASIDIHLDKKEVLEKASSFVKDNGLDLNGFEQAILFDSDYYASVYLQKTQGIRKANELIRAGLPVWFWQVRWFKELTKDGYYVSVDPATGEIIQFIYSILDDAKGENLSQDEARRLAEQHFQMRGYRLEDYEINESTAKKQKNRTDYHFVWQKKDYMIAAAYLRVGVSIYGDKLGYFSKYLDVPEEFLRDLSKEVALGQMLSIVPLVFIFLLVIAALFVFVVQFKTDRLNWKIALILGIIVAGLSLGAFLNSRPLLWAGYPDTMPKAVYAVISAAGALIGALLVGLMIFLFGSAGYSIAENSGREFGSLKNISTSVTVGYMLGFAFLGYITLFYLVGTKFFNIWMPPQTEYSNILSTGLPFLFPLTIALTAALSEEFLFRLFAVSFFKKYFKACWLGVIVSALIWAFAHSDYPVFPAYIRGIELTAAGIVFGLVFLKYGVLCVLIAHFVIDAALVGLPLVKSHNLYFVISGFIVIALALSPVLIFAAALKLKNKKRVLEVKNGA